VDILIGLRRFTSGIVFDSESDLGDSRVWKVLMLAANTATGLHSARPERRCRHRLAATPGGGFFRSVLSPFRHHLSARLEHSPAKLLASSHSLTFRDP
jgi:hypothetical protein